MHAHLRRRTVTLHSPAAHFGTHVRIRARRANSLAAAHHHRAISHGPCHTSACRYVPSSKLPSGQLCRARRTVKTVKTVVHAGPVSQLQDVGGCPPGTARSACPGYSNWTGRAHACPGSEGLGLISRCVASGTHQVGGLLDDLVGCRRGAHTNGPSKLRSSTSARARPRA